MVVKIGIFRCPECRSTTVSNTSQAATAISLGKGDFHPLLLGKGSSSVVGLLDSMAALLLEESSMLGCETQQGAQDSVELTVSAPPT